MKYDNDLNNKHLTIYKMTAQQPHNELRVILHNPNNNVIIRNIITNIINRIILRTTFDTLKLHTAHLRQQ